MANVGFPNGTPNNGLEYVENYVDEPDAESFEVDLLEGEISEKRFEELWLGEAEPTAEEIQLFKELYVEHQMGTGHFQSKWVYKVSGTDGRSVAIEVDVNDDGEPVGYGDLNAA